MNFEGLVFWISFIFCLALTAGGILVIFRFTALKGLPAFQHLQYFLILLYTFGFYGLWSESFLLVIPYGDELKPFSKVLAVLGIPFIVFSTIQQMYWCKSIFKKVVHRLVIPALTIVVGTFGFVQYYRLDWSNLESLPNIYALFGLVAAGFCGFLLVTQKTDLLTSQHRWVLTLIVIGQMAFYSFKYLTVTEELLFQSISHFIFFLINTGLSVYFVYTVKYEPISQSAPPSREAFIEKFVLTARESEIIREIYSGKTNQEIADALFVTLQTIKDHTSRIYQKTDVKSRAQLIRLMRDFG